MTTGKIFDGDSLHLVFEDISGVRISLHANELQDIGWPVNDDGDEMVFVGFVKAGDKVSNADDDTDEE